jgi:hypothetical protein
MSTRKAVKAATALAMIGLLGPLGCYHTSVDTSEHARGPAPLRMPSPAKEGQACGSYEDSLTGGQVFTMYCSYCHNARSLAERPFAQYQNAAAHMRVVANLTGKEYARLMEFLRRWHDVPPPNPPVEPSAKRLVFSQPIPELRPQTPAKGAPSQVQDAGPRREPPVQPQAAGAPPDARPPSAAEPSEEVR